VMFAPANVPTVACENPVGMSGAIEVVTGAPVTVTAPSALLMSVC